MRGYDWDDMIDGRREGIEAKDLLWAQYPTDDEIDASGVRGIYVGNYFKWDANEHTEHQRAVRVRVRRAAVRAHLSHDVQPRRHARERHPRLPEVRQVRLRPRAPTTPARTSAPGYMTREQAIEMVRRYDHVKPRATSSAGSTTSGMDEDEFDEIADAFRDPRVWRQRGRPMGEGQHLGRIIGARPVKCGRPRTALMSPGSTTSALDDADEAPRRATRSRSQVAPRSARAVRRGRLRRLRDPSLEP